jgi:hypothetical protein
MDDRVRLDLGECVRGARPVSDIEFVMFEVFVLLPEPLLIPRGVTLSAKEIAAHVIVDSVHFAAFDAKECYDFTANQAARTGYEQLFHASLIPWNVQFVKEKNLYPKSLPICRILLQQPRAIVQAIGFESFVQGS